MNSRKTLLHLEDDDSLVFLFRRLLEKEGFNYQPVPNVEDAIAYVAHQGRFSDAGQFPPPTIVVTDLSLAAGRSSAEFILWLRDHPEHRRTPVVVLTGGGNPVLEDRALRAGANAFVSKGIGMKELMDQLRAAFRTAGLK
jgi:DNA-binding response OmpR family regulator